MEDIGMSPDYRSMSPDQKNYETVTGHGFRCPWCYEVVEVPHEDLETLFYLALQEENTEEDQCGNCGAQLSITYTFVPEIAGPYTACVEPVITATKRVA